ncbi:hypothetical protein ACMYR3_03185 [Ampullimonas aquatilis]|uniref:hypothetical protein n=1 Tax=Ampullimonas aquatilis TaxID=1341549 RepID=UPI003C71C3DB
MEVTLAAANKSNIETFNKLEIWRRVENLFEQFNCQTSIDPTRFHPILNRFDLKSFQERGLFKVNPRFEIAMTINRASAEIKSRHWLLNPIAKTPKSQWYRQLALEFQSARLKKAIHSGQKY